MFKEALAKLMAVKYGDKIVHALAGIGVALVATATVGPAYAFIAALAVGVLKELVDMRAGGTGFDKLDAGATAAGGLVIQVLAFA
jgi:uncharacterized protein involved in cysteine biosynthesis